MDVYNFQCMSICPLGTQTENDFRCNICDLSTSPYLVNLNQTHRREVSGLRPHPTNNNAQNSASHQPIELRLQLSSLAQQLSRRYRSRRSRRRRQCHSSRFGRVRRPTWLFVQRHLLERSERTCRVLRTVLRRRQFES